MSSRRSDRARSGVFHTLLSLTGVAVVLTLGNSCPTGAMFRRSAAPSAVSVVTAHEVPRRVKVLLSPPLTSEAAIASSLTQLLVGASNPRQAQALLNILPSTSVDSAVCGYVFRDGDIAYNCRNCQADPTCVLCQSCFENSNHEGVWYQPSCGTACFVCASPSMMLHHLFVPRVMLLWCSARPRGVLPQSRGGWLL